jgi:glycosyltransferase involved in cell wall biosynthesis
MSEKRVPIKINWEGSLFVHHSLGMVNREILCAIAPDPRFSVRHVPYEPDTFPNASSPKFAALGAMTGGPHSDAAVHVRHRWPPDFTLPSSGAYVLFQPWEYGCLPVEWVEKIPGRVREVWVYTNYLRECYIASGLAAESVRIIPLGIDPNEFRPNVAPAAWLREQIGKKYSFLFNGGITLRKGIDILINAYLNEFRPNEEVCLVIKGSNSYKKELAAQIQDLSRRTDIARIIYVTQDILPNELPALYASCDCYVHPYRAEGYGLPIAEAMACARPVIVTGAGACRDFTEEDSAYLIKCETERLTVRAVADIPTVSNPFWLVPDMEDLRRLMRHVFENRDEARMKGENASRKIRMNHTWKHSVAAVAERIITITNS